MTQDMKGLVFALARLVGSGAKTPPQSATAATPGPGPFDDVASAMRQVGAELTGALLVVE